MNLSCLIKCKKPKVSPLIFITINVYQFTIDSIIPSIDDFDMNALKNMVEELQHEYTIGKDEDGSGQIDSSTRTPGENGGSGDNTDVQSHLALFDKLQAKED